MRQAKGSLSLRKDQPVFPTLPFLGQLKDHSAAPSSTSRAPLVSDDHLIAGLLHLLVGSPES